MVARFDNNDGRMRGRKLQERRLRKWTEVKGRCAGCNKLTEFSARPGKGFELDHIEALKASGGSGKDIDDNCQVLCAGPEGCHRKKTEKDMGFKEKSSFTPDGRVVW